MQKIQNIMASFGILVGIDQIDTILGIILLSINILTILFNTGFAIYKKIKSKDYEEIDDILKDSVDKLEDLKDKTSSKEEKGE